MVSQYAGRWIGPEEFKALIRFQPNAAIGVAPAWSASPRCWNSLAAERSTHANPAAWSGWLKEQLGEPKKLGKRDRKTGEQIDLDNFTAMPYAEIPSFVQRLRAETSICARALSSSS